MKIANLQTTKTRPALRHVRIAPAQGPMRFEEMMHSIAFQPGKIRICSRRLQRWMDFFGNY
jgi:hypothetical protein